MDINIKKYKSWENLDYYADPHRIGKGSKHVYLPYHVVLLILSFLPAYPYHLSLQLVHSSWHSVLHTTHRRTLKYALVKSPRLHLGDEINLNNISRLLVNLERKNTIFSSRRHLLYVLLNHLHPVRKIRFTNTDIVNPRDLLQESLLILDLLNCLFCFQPTRQNRRTSIHIENYPFDRKLFKFLSKHHRRASRSYGIIAKSCNFEVSTVLLKNLFPSFFFMQG